jgi:ABC-type multidrug transport system permease subunit
MSSIGVLVQERHVFARERANGFYGTAVYATAKVIFIACTAAARYTTHFHVQVLVCDVLPLRVLPPLFFGAVVYNLIGLNEAKGAMWLFLFVLVLINVAASSFCMLLSAACDDVSSANLIAAAFFLYSYMFSGLFMAGSHGSFIDIRYTSVFFYAWEALVANEFRPGNILFV